MQSAFGNALPKHFHHLKYFIKITGVWFSHFKKYLLLKFAFIKRFCPKQVPHCLTIFLACNSYNQWNIFTYQTCFLMVLCQRAGDRQLIWKSQWDQGKLFFWWFSFQFTYVESLRRKEEGRKKDRAQFRESCRSLLIDNLNFHKLRIRYYLDLQTSLIVMFILRGERNQRTYRLVETLHVVVYLGWSIYLFPHSPRAVSISYVWNLSD